MEKQVAVVASIDAAFLVQIINVRLKLRAFNKIIREFVNNFLFVVGQGVTVWRINLNRRESHAVFQFIINAVNRHAIFVKINFVEK